MAGLPYFVIGHRLVAVAGSSEIARANLFRKTTHPMKWNPVRLKCKRHINHARGARASRSPDSNFKKTLK